MIPRLQIRGRSRVQLGRIHLNLSYCTKNVSIIYRFVFADQNTRLSLYLYLHASSLNTARRDKPCINTIRPSGRVFYALYPGGYPFGERGGRDFSSVGGLGSLWNPTPKIPRNCLSKAEGQIGICRFLPVQRTLPILAFHIFSSSHLAVGWRNAYDGPRGAFPEIDRKRKVRNA